MNKLQTSYDILDSIRETSMTLAELSEDTGRSEKTLEKCIYRLLEKHAVRRTQIPSLTRKAIYRYTIEPYGLNLLWACESGFVVSRIESTARLLLFMRQKQRTTFNELADVWPFSDTSLRNRLAGFQRLDYICSEVSHIGSQELAYVLTDKGTAVIDRWPGFDPKTPENHHVLIH